MLAKNTDFSKAEFEQGARRRPDALGLPDYAKGNPEGYLFPATYAFEPDGQADRRCCSAMVDALARRPPTDADLEAGAEELGYTPARADDDRQPGRGRGPRRRHAQDRPGDLQPAGDRRRADQRPARRSTRPSTTRSGATSASALSAEDLAVGLAVQHLRKNAGLPPGPIEAPGDEAIEAAANPADGPLVLLRHGRT